MKSRTPRSLRPADPRISEPSDDVVSGIMKTISKPQTKIDDKSYLQDMHRSMLAIMFPEHGNANLGKIARPVNGSPRPLRTVIRRQLDPTMAERLIRRYESLQQCFPFVTLPKGWTLDSMSQKRPFLTLGILSAMSNANVSLQQRLDLAFRRALSELVLVNGDVSLDLLQGLMVYTAWSETHPPPMSKLILTKVSHASPSA
jgi:hypothetical protein